MYYVTLGIQIISWGSFAPIFVLEYENHIRKYWPERTFYTPRQQSKVKLTHRILTLTPMSLYCRCESHLQPVATRKPGSIETVCGTFQTKSAENCDDELTQSAHLRNPCLVLYTTVSYTFLYLVFFCARL